MGPPATTSDDSALPAPASIALAVAILHSKPPDTTAGEYIDQLNRSLGTQASDLSYTDSPIIDTAAYWKAEYERVQAQQLDTEEEVIRLTNEVEALKIIGQKTGQNGGRQRKSSKTTATANTQSKRQTLDLELTGKVVDAGPNEQIEQTENPDVDGLLRHLRILYAYNSSTATTDPQRSMLRLSTACVYVNKLVLVPEELAPRVLAICRCLYTTLQKCSDAQLDEAIVKQVCGRIVRIFETALYELHQVAITEVNSQEEKETSKRKKKHKPNSRAVKSSAAADAEKSRLRRESLVQIMAKMVSLVNLKDPSHMMLYEGLTSCLLNYVGSTLSFIVFADPQDAGVGLCPVSGLSDVSGLDPKLAVAVVELNAPHLVKLLRIVLSKVHGLAKVAKGDAKKRKAAVSCSEPVLESLVQQIERRLQNTLLRGIFGNDDEKFQDAFWSPEDVEEVELGDVPEEGEDTSKSEWFIAQVWEMLGWDILAGKMNTLSLNG